MPTRLIATEDDRQATLTLIRGLNIARPWTVTVERPKQKRSLSQNGLFHKWVDIIARETGYDGWDKDRMKEELKIVCDCPVERYKGLDGEWREERRTSGLDTKPMSDFMDRVARFAATELAIALPFPDDAQRRW